MSLTAGKKAPDFTLLDEDGQTVRLSHFKGKRVIVFFYPKAMTPGCTREACDFRDEVDAFKRREAVVLGISKDTPAAQRRFKDKYQLPFPLLSDESTDVQKAWGVWGEKNMYGKKLDGDDPDHGRGRPGRKGRARLPQGEGGRARGAGAREPVGSTEPSRRSPFDRLRASDPNFRSW